MTLGNVFRATLVVLLTLLGAYILFISRRILLVLVIAIVVASAVRPLVAWLKARRMPNGLAIVVVYLAILIPVLLVSVVVVPPVVNQIAAYIEQDSRLADQIIDSQRWVEERLSDVTNGEVSLVAPEEIRDSVSMFVDQLREALPNVVNDIGSLLGEAILVFVMGAYWLTSYKKATRFITTLFAPRHRDEVGEVIDEVEATMGGYVRGVVVIATTVAALNFIALSVLNVPDALVLAFVIGITSVIPMIGGVVGGIAATALALVQSPQFAVIVLVVFLVIQQFESYVLSPRVMGHQVDLDPLLVIVYTAIGFVLFGIIGAVVAVPVTGALHILLQHLVIEPRQAEINGAS